MSNKVTEEQVKSYIQKALKKINGTNENSICRYLPGEGNHGYMHHFTYRKLKSQEPEKFIQLLNKHIIDSTKLQSIPPKQRAARGSRKRPNQLNFTKNDIDRILQMARAQGEKDLIRKLSRKDLKALKRELIQNIKNNRIDQELWNSYVDAITNQQVVESETHGRQFAHA